MQNLTDEKLVEIYRNGKGRKRHKAFNCLYLRYISELREYFFFALGRDEERGKDFAQDLFLKVLESPEKFDTSKVFRSWIFRVATNMSKNEYRSLVVERKYQEHVVQTSTFQSTLEDTNASLKIALQKISKEQRSLIVLRFKIALSIKEIAEIHNCSEGTIKSRLFYATKELSKHYKNLSHA